MLHKLNCYWCVLAINCTSDIVFVVNESRSIGSNNFARVKTFLSQIIRRLDIDSRNTRVGLVTYSTSARVRFYLSSHSSVAAVLSAISRLSYSGGSSNNIAAALSYVRRYMLTSSRGDRSNAPNVIVVLTNGQSSNPSETQVSTTLRLLLKSHISERLRTRSMLLIDA